MFLGELLSHREVGVGHVLLAALQGVQGSGAAVGEEVQLQAQVIVRLAAQRRRAQARAPVHRADVQSGCVKNQSVGVAMHGLIGRNEGACGDAVEAVLIVPDMLSALAVAARGLQELPAVLASLLGVGGLLRQP